MYFMNNETKDLRFYDQIYKGCVSGIYRVYRFSKPNVWRVYITQRYNVNLSGAYNRKNAVSSFHCVPIAKNITGIIIIFQNADSRHDRIKTNEI